MLPATKKALKYIGSVLLCSLAIVGAAYLTIICDLWQTTDDVSVTVIQTPPVVEDIAVPVRVTKVEVFETLSSCGTYSEILYIQDGLDMTGEPVYRPENNKQNIRAWECGMRDALKRILSQARIKVVVFDPHKQVIDRHPVLPYLKGFPPVAEGMEQYLLRGIGPREDWMLQRYQVLSTPLCLERLSSLGWNRNGTIDSCTFLAVQGAEGIRKNTFQSLQTRKIAPGYWPDLSIREVQLFFGLPMRRI